MIGTLALSRGCTLWDLDMEGGGPGGGGGTPMLLSHRVCDPDRDRAEVGVSIAPADTALRAAGGPFGNMLVFVINAGRMGSGV